MPSSRNSVATAPRSTTPSAQRLRRFGIVEIDVIFRLAVGDRACRVRGANTRSIAFADLVLDRLERHHAILPDSRRHFARRCAARRAPSRVMSNDACEPRQIAQAGDLRDLRARGFVGDEIDMQSRARAHRRSISDCSRSAAGSRHRFHPCSRPSRSPRCRPDRASAIAPRSQRVLLRQPLRTPRAHRPQALPRPAPARAPA